MKTTHGWALPDGDTHFSDHLAKEFEQNGAAGYQTKKWLAALPLVKGRRNAIDIGAHVGLWTVPMAGAFKTVTAFEPMPDLAACWIENTTGLENARLYQVALGNADGAIDMVAVAANSGNAHVSVNLHGGRTSREEARVAPGGENTISVPLRRLDDYAFGAVDFIKIDVEGFELSVIRGGELTIKANKPVMVVEQKPGNGARFGVSDTAAVDLLCKWGAEIAWVKAGDYCMTWRGQD